MRIFLLLIITFLITGCSLNEPKYENKPNDKLKLANEIRRKVANQLKEKYNLIPCGSGGQMMYEIKMLALSFDYCGPIDVEKGRELLLAAINEFKDAVNADARIHPYLFNYPFEAKNIEIRIFIRNPDGTIRTNGKLTVISAIKNVLVYDTRNSNSFDYITIHEETYDEAMQKIEDSSKEQVSEVISKR